MAHREDNHGLKNFFPRSDEHPVAEGGRAVFYGTFTGMGGEICAAFIDPVTDRIVGTSSYAALTKEIKTIEGDKDHVVPDSDMPRLIELDVAREHIEGRALGQKKYSPKSERIPSKDQVACMSEGVEEIVGVESMNFNWDEDRAVNKLDGIITGVQAFRNGWTLILTTPNRKGSVERPTYCIAAPPHEVVRQLNANGIGFPPFRPEGSYAVGQRFARFERA